MVHASMKIKEHEIYFTTNNNVDIPLKNFVGSPNHENIFTQKIQNTKSYKMKISKFTVDKGPHKETAQDLSSMGQFDQPIAV